MGDGPALPALSEVEGSAGEVVKVGAGEGVRVGVGMSPVPASAAQSERLTAKARMNASGFFICSLQLLEHQLPPVHEADWR